MDEKNGIQSKSTCASSDIRVTNNISLLINDPTAPTWDGDPKKKKARTPMLFILGICCFIEQYHSFWLEDKLMKMSVDIHIARKVILLLNFLVLLYESIRYRDMNDVNNEILKKMFSKIESLNNEVTVLKKKSGGKRW